MRLPSLMIAASTAILVAGVVAGIVMGVQQNFTLAPAHAHLNLVGGVLLFLVGLYYKVVPAAAELTLARVQGWLHLTGAILFPLGIALVLGVGHGFEPVAIVGSLVVLAAMALFAVVVLRTAQA